jgi:hypothetical protein
MTVAQPTGCPIEGVDALRPISGHPCRVTALICRTCTLVLALLLGFAAIAHEGGTGLTVNPVQVMPGAQLFVDGVNLPENMTVTLVLETEGARWVLGEVVSDDHGDFMAAFRVPEGLPNGLFTLHAVNTNKEPSGTVVATVGVFIGQRTSGAPGVLNRRSWVAVVGVVGVVSMAALALLLAVRQRVRKPRQPR